MKNIITMFILAAGLILYGCMTTGTSKSSQPSETDIVTGLKLIQSGEHVKAIAPLENGLIWLKTSPSFKDSNDPLVSKEVEFIEKLMLQIAMGGQKGVFNSTNDIAKIIVSAIDTQANVILSIDERRRKQAVQAKLNTNAIVPFNNNPVVCVKEGSLYETNKLDSSSKELSLGQTVQIVEDNADRLFIKTSDNTNGWVPRCFLCDTNEFRRRVDNEEIPTRVASVGANSRGTFLYGSMKMVSGGYDLEGQGFCMDDSTTDKSFKVAKYTIQRKPNIVYLYKDDNIIELKIIGEPK